MKATIGFVVCVINGTINGTINDATLNVLIQHVSIKTWVWYERSFSLAHKPGFILSIVLSWQCATVVNLVKHCF